MQCSTDSQRQDNCNATLSLTSSSLVCLYTDEEDLGWRLSSTFHFTIRCKLQQVSTVKLTGLQSCVCVCPWARLFSICRWTADRILLTPHLAFWVSSRGFYVCAPNSAGMLMGAQCAYLTAYLCSSVFFVVFLARGVGICLCVSLTLCIPVRLRIVSGCEKGQSTGWQHTERSCLGGKYCRCVRLHAGKVEWRAGAVRCFSFCLSVFFCPSQLFL